MTLTGFLLLILLAFICGIFLVVLVIIKVAGNNPERVRLFLGGQSVLDAEYYRAKSEAATDTVNFFGRLIATNFQYIRGQENTPTTPPIGFDAMKRHETPFVTPLNVESNHIPLQIGEGKTENVKYDAADKVKIGKGVNDDYEIRVTPAGGCRVVSKQTGEDLDTFDLYDVYIGTPYEIENTAPKLYAIRCQNCKGWKITKEKGSQNCSNQCKMEFHRKTK